MITSAGALPTSVAVPVLMPPKPCANTQYNSAIRTPALTNTLCQAADRLTETAMRTYPAAVASEIAAAIDDGSASSRPVSAWAGPTVHVGDIIQPIAACEASPRAPH